MKMKFGFTAALVFLMTWTLCAQTNQPAPVLLPPPTNDPAAASSAGLEQINAPPAKAKAPVKKKKKAAKSAAKKKAVLKSDELISTSAKKSDEHLPINPAEMGTVRQRNVNVRGQPSFTGEVITKLHKGESVTLLEEINKAKFKQDEPPQWYRIAMPTNTPVWVSAHFVDENKTVTPKKLKVRAGPGENFSMVGMLEKGAIVKEIRTVGDWIEIEMPGDVYAFVAAELIERQGAPTTPVPPEEPPQVVAVTPTPAEVPLAQNPTNETPRVAEQTATPPVEPVIPPVVAPPVEEPLPKRIVTREGIIRRSLNVQTPSYFELESPRDGKTINYLYNPQPNFTLKGWVGKLALVTGEESIDKRWPNTPVIEIENIDLR